MKNKLAFFLFTLGLPLSSVANHSCFIAKENNSTLIQKGDCHQRHAPCSTFKIAISLMGYNEGILMDQSHPAWPFKPGYVDEYEPWRHEQTPRSWIKNSCVWYSQLITERLGMKKFSAYVRTFDYGNQDVTGDPGKNNGLTHAWLSSSLQIAPIEQLIFLQKLLSSTLPVSPKAHAMTRDILFVETLPGDWKLYGKTGSGHELHTVGSQQITYPIGWFVGWVEKGHRAIVFAQYLESEAKQTTLISLRAKAMAKDVLINHILNKTNVKKAKVNAQNRTP